MVLFPNCKINLGLNIVRKRNDGFHDIETLFYPLLLQDALEVIEIDKPEDLQSSVFNIQLSVSGEIIKGDPENNLCYKAYHLLKKDFPQLPSIKIHLHKVIPPGAGLGGGSADGAFTLKILNQKFGLGLTTEKLLDCALKLGSDCPFFIINLPSFATGRGELLEPTELDLSGYKIVVVNPNIHISTAEVFSSLAHIFHSKSVKKIIQQGIGTWRTELKNDFEEPVFTTHPELKSIKETLYEAGAVYSSMSGSGGAVYGIFPENKNVKLEFPENYFVRELISKG